MALVTDLSEPLDRERRDRHLEQAAALGSLAVGIAHELNNPIASILSRIELVIMEVEEQCGTPELVADQLLADLQALHRQAQRLTRIAQDILAFGRQRQRNRQPIDLSALVRDTLLVARTQLSRDIQVDAVLDGGLPRILGDPTVLGLAVMSLLLNAREAMPTGGVVRIGTAAIRGPSQPDSVRLMMSHSGPAPQESSFDLSLGSAIVRDHGGTIDVRSEPDRATTFTLDFPSTEGAAT